jgi:hypothetical protein
VVTANPYIPTGLASRESQVQSTPHLAEIERWGVREFAIARVEWKTISRPKGVSTARLEANYDSGLYAEIALIVVATGERIAETR